MCWFTLFFGSPFVCVNVKPTSSLSYPFIPLPKNFLNVVFQVKFESIRVSIYVFKIVSEHHLWMPPASSSESVIKVSRWKIFMEQRLGFGQDFGRFGNFWGHFFFCFRRQKKNFKNILDGENHRSENRCLVPTFMYLHSNSTQILALIKNVFFTFSGSKKLKKKCKIGIMQLFSAEATMFSKKF